jgi:hypothetical protein
VLSPLPPCIHKLTPESYPQNAAIGGGELLAFTLIRQQFRTIYEPRTFIPEKEE